MKRLGGQARGRRRVVVWILLPLLILAVPLAGLLWFAATLPSAVPHATQRSDAIVVLTGGSGRLSQGLDLLAQGAAPKLFVSGVYRGVEVDELLTLSRRDPQNLQCCIALGYEADDTRGNAAETAAWMRAEGFSSLRLVTAVYHMPRSLLEFRRAMPEVAILPNPVFPPGFQQRAWWRSASAITLLANEFAKYLLAQARGLLPWDGTGEALPSEDARSEGVPSEAPRSGDAPA